VLTTEQAREFYDRFGRKQDGQAFYEDAALDDLVAHAGFEDAGGVFEFGCGTGRFAARLLANELPPTASYLGVDLSSTMIGIARERIAEFGARARVEPAAGPVAFPLPDGAVDRVVSTYVLDLLPERAIAAAVEESARVLAAGGRLCLVGLTVGPTAASRIVSGLWSAVFRLNARLVGGCRPVRLDAYVGPPRWVVEYRNVVVSRGVPSEVLVASSTGSSPHRGPAG